MSYSTSSPPARIAGKIGGNAIWHYSSADDDATVIAASYITDALDLGMQVGDFVWIFDTAGIGTPAVVTAVSSSGSTMAYIKVS